MLRNQQYSYEVYLHMARNWYRFLYFLFFTTFKQLSSPSMQYVEPQYSHVTLGFLISLMGAPHDGQLKDFTTGI